MALALILVGIIVTVFMFAYFARRWHDSCLLSNIPSPPRVPFFGHLLRFRDEKKILSEMMKIQHEYGGVVKLNALVFYLILVTDYKFTEFLLNNTKILDKSHEYTYFRRWLGSGLLTSKPDKWKKTRRIITPTFHFQILEQFIDVFNSASDILIKKMERGLGKDSIDIYPYITLCALDIICDYWRERKVLNVIHGYTNSVIKKRKEEVAGNKKSNTNGEARKRLAFLDLLLESTIDGRPMTDEEIRDEVNTFMFEGHDTTASAITFTLYCLGKDLDAQNKVVDELRDIFGTNKKIGASSEDLHNMKYLEMVIKEALRLYPSVPLYARKMKENTEYCGGILPKGISISIFAYGLHRDPQIYPNPEKFDPERFTKENQQGRGPFSYLPFSAGPRNCIGQKFAMLEMKAVVAKILRHYEILPVEGFEPILVPDTILKSVNGVEVCLKERDF